ncbi:hypothetical protein [Parendozoicomonas sp. Alg238-R29]|uniref:hypothetical protein n=1 Tax=Parendozoicomonas sp. Alg238-R29 TaxID=2993446 RepID=UPI00248E37CD|nr:hypothetical protein [Parendozoicomonas sp. Alg238-R29]
MPQTIFFLFFSNPFSNNWQDNKPLVKSEPVLIVRFGMASNAIVGDKELLNVVGVTPGLPVADGQHKISIVIQLLDTSG